ncbi:hypothetical protein KAH37_04235 [bacterium]|nr:hypothetical protein [bacterium]
MAKPKSDLSLASADSDASEGFVASMNSASPGGQWNPSARTTNRKKGQQQQIALSSFDLKPKRSVKNSSYELRYFFLITVIIMLAMLIHHIMKGDLGAYFAHIEQILFGWM